MKSLSVSFNAIVPLFLIMGLGYLAKRQRWITYESSRQMNKTAFYTLMPVMLFNNIYLSDFSRLLSAKYIVFVCSSIALMYFASIFIARKIETERSKLGVIVQASFRSNFVLLGVPLAASLLPDADMGIPSVSVAIVVPAFNILAVLVLENYRGGKTEFKPLVINILKNPLIIASVLGILVKAIDIRMPRFIESFMSKAGSAASPVLLLLLGASFEMQNFKNNKKDLAACVGMRLLLFPALILFTAFVFGFRGIEFVTLLVLSSAPTAVNSFNMAQQMGGDEELAGAAVTTSTALSFFTLFFWCTLFKFMGAY